MTSSTISRQASAPQCRRFRFAFADASKPAASARRTAAVADHVETWMNAAVIAEQRLGSECLVTVETGRPVPVAVAERFCRECPHYVRGTFAAAGSIRAPEGSAKQR
jgi:hypothetical protein